MCWEGCSGGGGGWSRNKSKPEITARLKIVPTGSDRGAAGWGNALGKPMISNHQSGCFTLQCSKPAVQLSVIHFKRIAFLLQRYVCWHTYTQIHTHMCENLLVHVFGSILSWWRDILGANGKEVNAIIVITSHMRHDFPRQHLFF